jgi:integrase
MTGRPSVTRQVDMALRRLEAFDQSRAAAKRNGTADKKIFSFSTRHEYQRVCARFARWVEDTYQVKWLRDLKPEHAETYIAHLRQQGCSPDYVSKVISVIRKLNTAMDAMGWYPSGAPRLLAEEHGRHSDPRPVPYTPEEAKQLIAELYRRDPQYGQIAQLQHVAGLRREETIHLQARCIAEDGSCVLLQGPGTHAKGGREREIPIDDKAREFMRQMREQAMQHKDRHVFVQRKTLGGAYDNARRAANQRLGIEARGTHGFRKLFAAELYKRVQDEGASDEEAQRDVAEELGHRRTSVFRHYLPPDGTSLF